jgi:Mn-dependent DtxR family transcriptional regulator
MAHDRARGSDEFPMTHEFLSMMLGVRRAGISTSANALQRAGMIEYERGRMRITDRPGLESAACECYGIVRRAYDGLLGK